MLRVEELHVSYGRIHAVRGVSLEVGEGELVGLVGPNGAGKSSTLNAVAGAVAATGGKILFDGRSIKGEPPETIVRRGICLVPEGRQVFTRLTVGENLRLAAETVGNRSSQAMQAIFDRFPILERYRNTPAGRLSGGEQQQLVIARALLGRPRLLMLDEPSLGLAPRLVDEVFRLLLTLKSEGTTILLVEQNAAQTVRIADRSWVMSNGRAEPIDVKGGFGSRDELIAAYLGRTRAQST